MKNTLRLISGLLLAICPLFIFAHGGDDHVHLTESIFIPATFFLVIVVATGVGALLKNQSRKNNKGVEK